MIRVYGQRGDGPVVWRDVSLQDFITAWGMYAPLILRASDRGMWFAAQGCRVLVVR